MPEHGAADAGLCQVPVLHRRVGDGLLLLHPDRDEGVSSLNVSAAAVYDAFSTPRTSNVVVERLCRAHPTEPAVADGVRRTIDSLRSEGWLTSAAVASAVPGESADRPERRRSDVTAVASAVPGESADRPERRRSDVTAETSVEGAVLTSASVDASWSVTVEQFRSVRGWAGRHRLRSALFDVVDREVVEIIGPATQVDLLRAESADAARDAAAVCLQLEREALRFRHLAAAAGWEFLVLKGVATSHLDCPTPAVRDFGDVDVLVDPDVIDDLHPTLLGAGYHCTTHLYRGRPSSRSSLTYRTPSGWELDVHRMLSASPFGRLLERARLRAEPSRVTIGGHQLAALRPAARFVHAAMHWTMSDRAGRRLSSLQDLFHQMPHSADVLDDVLDLARTAHLEPVVEAALRDLSEVVGEPPLRFAWPSRRPSWLDRTVHRRARDGGPDPRWSFAGNLAYARSGSDRFALLRDVVTPGAAYVDGVGGWGARLRRWRSSA